jgi:sulfite reductase (NADPH) hemoprotein beta-component
MKVLTANRLADGAVIYLARNGGWTHALDDAQRLAPDVAAEALTQAQDLPRFLVGPYLVEIGEGVSAGEIEPRERLRETIRADGPTVGHSLGWEP